MIIQYNIPQLTKLIRNLFDLTGISLSVLDTDYKRLTHCAHPEDFCTLLQTTENGALECQKCDRKILKRCSRSGVLEGHICGAGLYDSAMPIKKNDSVVGYVIMGRVRSVKSPASCQRFSGTDPVMEERLNALYQQLPVMTEKQLSALYAILPSVLFDSAITIIYDPLVNDIVEYIRGNLKEDLSVKHLCSRFHISANHLYNAFRANLDRTVNEFVTEQRLTRAKELLLTTNEPVYAVAEQVGIGNYPYFCNLFKKKNGCAPKQFRERGRN